MVDLKIKALVFTAVSCCVIVAATAQDTVNKIQFNNGAGGATINLVSDTEVSASVSNGVLNLDVPGVKFRVKCALVAGENESDCVVYAGGGSLPDSDSDGVLDSADLCPGTPSSETPDAVGCSITQRDSDSDGVKDHLDTCPNTPSVEASQVDVNGCGPSQQTSTAGYCSPLPSGYSCNPNDNWDPWPITDRTAKSYGIPRLTAISNPFTVTPNSGLVRGSFIFKNNDALETGFQFRAWLSATPGGPLLDGNAFCELLAGDPNGFRLSLSNSEEFCSVGNSKRVLHLNMGVVDEAGNLTYGNSQFFMTVTYRDF